MAVCADMADPAITDGFAELSIAKPKCAFAKLPAEIWTRIIKLVARNDVDFLFYPWTAVASTCHKHTSLFNLSLTCKRLHALVTPVLYTRIMPGCTFAHDEEKLQLYHDKLLTAYAANRDTSRFANTERLEVYTPVDPSKLLSSILLACCNLKSLHLIAPAVCPGHAEDILHSLSAKSASKLKDLRVLQLGLFRMHPFVRQKYINGILQFCGPLDKLGIIGLAMNGGDDRPQVIPAAEKIKVKDLAMRMDNTDGGAVISLPSTLSHIDVPSIEIIHVDWQDLTPHDLKPTPHETLSWKKVHSVYIHGCGNRDASNVNCTDFFSWISCFRQLRLLSLDTLFMLKSRRFAAQLLSVVPPQVTVLELPWPLSFSITLLDLMLMSNGLFVECMKNVKLIRFVSVDSSGQAVDHRKYNRHYVTGMRGSFKGMILDIWILVELQVLAQYFAMHNVKVEPATFWEDTRASLERMQSDPSVEMSSDDFKKYWDEQEKDM